MPERSICLRLFYLLLLVCAAVACVCLLLGGIFYSVAKNNQSSTGDRAEIMTAKCTVIAGVEECDYDVTTIFQFNCQMMTSGTDPMKVGDVIYVDKTGTYTCRMHQCDDCSTDYGMNMIYVGIGFASMFLLIGMIIVCYETKIRVLLQDYNEFKKLKEGSYGTV